MPRVEGDRLTPYFHVLPLCREHRQAAAVHRH